MDALEQFEATTGISLITLVPVVVLSIIAFVYLRRKLAAPPKPRLVEVNRLCQLTLLRNIPTFAVPKPKPKAKSKPTSDGKHIKIFFGSQTGTAEGESPKRRAKLKHNRLCLDPRNGREAVGVRT